METDFLGSPAGVEPQPHDRLTHRRRGERRGGKPGDRGQPRVHRFAVGGKVHARVFAESPRPGLAAVEVQRFARAVAVAVAVTATATATAIIALAAVEPQLGHRPRLGQHHRGVAEVVHAHPQRIERSIAHREHDGRRLAVDRPLCEKPRAVEVGRAADADLVRAGDAACRSGGIGLAVRVRFGGRRLGRRFVGHRCGEVGGHGHAQTRRRQAVARQRVGLVGYKPLDTEIARGSGHGIGGVGVGTLGGPLAQKPPAVDTVQLDRFAVALERHPVGLPGHVEALRLGAAEAEVGRRDAHRCAVQRVIDHVDHAALVGEANVRPPLHAALAQLDRAELARPGGQRHAGRRDGRQRTLRCLLAGIRIRGRVGARAEAELRCAGHGVLARRDPLMDPQVDRGADQIFHRHPLKRESHGLGLPPGRPRRGLGVVSGKGHRRPVANDLDPPHGVEREEVRIQQGRGRVAGPAGGPLLAFAGGEVVQLEEVHVPADDEQSEQQQHGGLGVHGVRIRQEDRHSATRLCRVFPRQSRVATWKCRVTHACLFGARHPRRRTR